MKKNKLPQHISFIMDGNNRWSKYNDTDKVTSYKQGAYKLINITNYIFKKYDNVQFISAFGLSQHNLKRSKNFIKLFKNIFKSLLEEFSESKFPFGIKFIGDMGFFDVNTKLLIKKVESSQSSLNKRLLIFLNYSGKADIENSIHYLKNDKSLNKSLSNHLSTKNIPDPDILFRTGGYKRISDFMLYQISFTELFFTNKLWPDIKNKDIDKFMTSFKNIERKFGR